MGMKSYPPPADFHIPSKDELDALYNFIATNQSPLSTAYKIGVNGSPYWTSSEASDTFAWYQLFHDGTQFTDATASFPDCRAINNSRRVTSTRVRRSNPPQ